MRIAILSDIHSNKYALKNTLDFLNNQNIDKYIFLGDYFGYYPWANDTYNLLMTIEDSSIFLLGNHDELLINKIPEKIPEYYHVIEQNKSNLPDEALLWLSKLQKKIEVKFDDTYFIACHGTPADLLNGRYYPDNIENYDWFPKRDTVLLLGHTHYPICKSIKGGGTIINPGSVGQSRDGNISSSFCIFDTETKSNNFYRTTFDSNMLIKILEEMQWYPRAINSLSKQVK